MERLTEKISNGIAICEAICKKCEHEDYSCTECSSSKAVDKLAAYEDLEEQGLLIKLPCKVGDYVYEANIGRKIVAAYKVTSVTIMTHSRNYGWELIEGIYSNLKGFNEFALGRTVFLTREEAEKALEVSDGRQ